MKNLITNSKTSKFVVQILLFSMTILMVIISCNKEEKLQEDTQKCDITNLGIDTVYRHPPSIFPNSNGDYVSQTYWYWTKRQDTILFGGYYDDGSEAGSSIHLFFKKNDNCIDFLYWNDIQYEDNVVIDQNGNYVTPWYYMHTRYNGDVNLDIQQYVEDSIFVGKVGSIKFWIDFLPQYEHPDPWDYEVIPNP